MSIMFHQVMQMSITASYVIIAVLLLRLLLRKTPKKYSYMLWAAVLFRLCCPFSFSSVLSIFNLVWSKNEKVIIDLSEVPVSSAEPITETVQTISHGSDTGGHRCNGSVRNTAAVRDIYAVSDYSFFTRTTGSAIGRSYGYPVYHMGRRCLVPSDTCGCILHTLKKEAKVIRSLLRRYIPG